MQRPLKAKTQRLWILGVSLACLTLATGLILYSLQENITFFFTPSELDSKKLSSQKRIRLGGIVEKNSLRQEGLNISFNITDFKATLKVHFQGIPPDLFKEGQGVVAEGYLVHPNLFEAKTLLAKHDENYMPPELAHLKLPDKKP